MKSFYFDNAATTPTRTEVIDAMVGVLNTNYGNASSSYAIGRQAKSLIETCRKTIADILNVSSGELVFTSGGTEASNLILRSAVRDLGIKHIVTSKIEHHAVLNTLKQLEKEYALKISYLKVDHEGYLDYEQFETILKEHTNTLVSLMHINNELGTILNIEKVATLCKAHNAFFHTDAVQSIGHYKLNLDAVKIDFLSASAHKFHGPKGIGFAFIRKGSAGLDALIFGGEQERGMRAGTESVHNIVGLEKAIALAYNRLEKETAYLIALKTYFISKLKEHIPAVRFNGNSDNLEKTANTLLNVRLPLNEKKSNMLLFQLDLKGIACSKGSACQSGSNQKSHVLREILSENELGKASIRFSLSIYNTKEEIDYVVRVLVELLN